MAWIESNEELATHPKAKRAARLLGISMPTMIGHLHMLWWWCLKYAQDGDITEYDSADIADACCWDGDPDDFINTLLNCGPGESKGFLEETEDGQLLVHDWMDYAGRLIEKRQANTKRMRNARKKNVQEVCNARATHNESTCNERAGATVPNLTVPNHTVPFNNNNNAREELEESESKDAQDVPDLAENPSETEEVYSMALGTRSVQWAQTNWGRMISPKEIDDIIAWCDEFSTRGSPDSDAVVIEGLKCCNDAGVRNLNYLRSVLTDWRESGVLTVEHIAARDAERKKQKIHKRTAVGEITKEPDKYENFYL